MFMKSVWQSKGKNVEFKVHVHDLPSSKGYPRQVTIAVNYLIFFIYMFISGHNYVLYIPVVCIVTSFDAFLCKLNFYIIWHIWHTCTCRCFQYKGLSIIQNFKIGLMENNLKKLIQTDPNNERIGYYFPFPSKHKIYIIHLCWW